MFHYSQTAAEPSFQKIINYPKRLTSVYVQEIILTTFDNEKRLVQRVCKISPFYFDTIFIFVKINTITNQSSFKKENPCLTQCS